MRKKRSTKVEAGASARVTPDDIAIDARRKVMVFDWGFGEVGLESLDGFTPSQIETLIDYFGERNDEP